MTLSKIGMVGPHQIMAPREPFPRWLMVENLPVIVNADGANGQTRASAERARRLGIETHGATLVPLAAYYPQDFRARTDWYPAGRGAYGLDAPESGGTSPADAWGWLVIDGHPVIQGPHDPAPSAFVSTTALRNHDLPERSPRAYHDSAGSPGWTLPSSDLARLRVELGDLAWAEFAGKGMWLQACDSGHHGRLVEVSVYACEELEINPRARNGGAPGGLRLTIIPRSRIHIVDSKGRPRPGTAAEIAVAGPVAARAAGLEIGIQ